MIKPKQIYRDKDSRMSGGNRLLLVESIEGRHARLRPCHENGEVNRYGKPTKISLAALEKRFVLHSDISDDILFEYKGPVYFRPIGRGIAFGKDFTYRGTVRDKDNLQLEELFEGDYEVEIVICKPVKE